MAGVPQGWLYNERKECQDYIDLTKQFYEGQIADQKELNDKFFSLYKMNVDSSFSLYKNHIDDSFRLYRKKSEKDAESLVPHMNRTIPGSLCNVLIFLPILRR